MLDNLSVFAKRRPDGAELGADSLTKDQRALLALSNSGIKVSEAAVDAADEAALQEALMQSAAGAGYAPPAPRTSSPNTQPAGSPPKPGAGASPPSLPSRPGAGASPPPLPPKPAGWHLFQQQVAGRQTFTGVPDERDNLLRSGSRNPFTTMVLPAHLQSRPVPLPGTSQAELSPENFVRRMRRADRQSEPVLQRSGTGSTLHSPSANSSTTTFVKKSTDENPKIDDEKRLPGSPQSTGVASKGPKGFSKLVSFFENKIKTIRTEIAAENASRRRRSEARMKRAANDYPSASEQDLTGGYGDGRWDRR